MLGSGPLASGSIASSSTTAKGMALAPGVFAFTGYTDAAEDTRSLALQPGNLTLVGGRLAYGEAYTMVAALGSYGLTLFKPYSPLRRIFIEAPVTYALTGQSTIIRRSRVGRSVPATYTLTGSPAGTGMSPAPMTAGKGVFALRGFARVSTARSLIGQPGAILLGGPSNSLMAYSGLPILRGQFLFAFPRVAMIRTRTMKLAPGAFVSIGGVTGSTSASGGRADVTPFTLAGQSVMLVVARNLSLVAGRFAANTSERFAVKQAIPAMPAFAGGFALGGEVIKAMRHHVLVSRPGVFELIARDTSLGYDDGMIVKEAVVSMICSVGTTRAPTWRARPNPANGMLLDTGHFGVTPAIAGLGRQMVIEPGDLVLTGAAA